MTKYKYLITTILISIFLSSCDKGIDTVEYESTVYLPSDGIREVAPLLGESVYQVGLFWAGVNAKESGITVYLKIDADSLERYIAVNRHLGSFRLLPEKYYDVPETTVNLSGNCSLVNIRFKNIDETFIDNDYILPVSIESVSPLVHVHPEMKTIFLHLKRFRNVYEGVYKPYGPITSDDNEVVSKVDKPSVEAVTVNANTIMVEGPEPNMLLLLTVKSDGTVEIKSVPPSSSGEETEHDFQAQNIVGYESVYTGKFNHEYQRSWGVFDLYYQYVLSGGANMYVHAELKSWR